MSLVRRGESMKQIILLLNIGKTPLCSVNIFLQLDWIINELIFLKVSNIFKFNLPAVTIFMLVWVFCLFVSFLIFIPSLSKWHFSPDYLYLPLCSALTSIIEIQFHPSYIIFFFTHWEACERYTREQLCTSTQGMLVAISIYLHF